MCTCIHFLVCLRTAGRGLAPPSFVGGYVSNLNLNLDQNQIWWNLIYSYLIPDLILPHLISSHLISSHLSVFLCLECNIQSPLRPRDFRSRASRPCQEELEDEERRRSLASRADGAIGPIGQAPLSWRLRLWYSGTYSYVLAEIDIAQMNSNMFLRYI